MEDGSKQTDAHRSKVLENEGEFIAEIEEGAREFRNPKEDGEKVKAEIMVGIHVIDADMEKLEDKI